MNLGRCGMKQRYFTANHSSDEVVRNSSSGGVFTAITDEWFSVYKEKAVVYGCVMDERLKAKHVRATTIEERNRMRGSKYIASEVSGVYKSVLNDLQNKLYVLFSGTPCQISGLKSFLRVSEVNSDDRLLTVEIVCHGVGSNKFFDDYISHLEKKYASKAVNCSFRSKSRQGKSEDMEVVFENGKRYNASTTRYDWFYSAYIKNYILRPSCFSCRYSKIEREADICISDNWKEFYSDSPNKHFSAVIISSELGCKWFGMCTENLSFTEKCEEEIYQENLYNPSSKPDDIEKFWTVYKDGGYIEVQKYLGNNTIKGYIRSAAADFLNRFNLIDTVKKLKRAIKR